MKNIFNTGTALDAEKDKSQFVIPVKKESQQIGIKKIPKGHKMFRMDLVTLKIEPAAYEKSEPVLDRETGKALIRHKLVWEDGFVYTNALNLKNAYKRFVRMIQGEELPYLGDMVFDEDGNRIE